MPGIPLRDLLPGTLGLSASEPLLTEPSVVVHSRVQRDRNFGYSLFLTVNFAASGYITALEKRWLASALREEQSAYEYVLYQSLVFLSPAGRSRLKILLDECDAQLATPREYRTVDSSSDGISESQADHLIFRVAFGQASKAQLELFGHLVQKNQTLKQRVRNAQSVFLYRADLDAIAYLSIAIARFADLRLSEELLSCNHLKDDEGTPVLRRLIPFLQGLNEAEKADRTKQRAQVLARTQSRMMYEGRPPGVPPPPPPASLPARAGQAGTNPPRTVVSGRGTLENPASYRAMLERSASQSTASASSMSPKGLRATREKASISSTAQPSPRAASLAPPVEPPGLAHVAASVLSRTSTCVDRELTRVREDIKRTRQQIEVEKAAWRNTSAQPTAETLQAIRFMRIHHRDVQETTQKHLPDPDHSDAPQASAELNTAYTEQVQIAGECMELRMLNNAAAAAAVSGRSRAAPANAFLPPAARDSGVAVPGARSSQPASATSASGSTRLSRLGPDPGASPSGSLTTTNTTGARRSA